MKKKLIVTCLLSLFLATPPIVAADFVIKDIRVEGLQRIEPDTVFDYLPIKIGEKFTATKGEAIIKDLYATGYFEDVQVEIQNNQVLLTVVERPIIDTVTIKGGKALSNQLIKDNMNRMGVGEAKVYNPYLVKALTDGLQQEYQNLGKNNVTIEPKVTELERHRVALEVNINEGPTTRIRHVIFEGNNTFSAMTLKRHMNLGRHTVMSYLTKNDIYSVQKSTDDQKALTDFYKNKGFYDFQILSFEPEIAIDTPKNMDLKIVVNEGPRYTWGKITVRGDVKEVSLEKLQDLADHHNKRFALSSSKWFNQSQLDRVVADIKMELGKSGYAKADVKVSPIRNADGSLDFDIEVAAKNKVYVREINISGNTKTRDEVIRREFRQQENSVYNSEKIARSQQKVGELGYFEDLKVDEKPVGDTDDEVDLNVDVKETNAGLFEFGVGYVQDDGVVVTGKFNHNNLWGTGRQISVNVSTGGTSRALSVDYLNPYYTRYGVGMGFDLSAIKYDPDDIETSSYKAKTFAGGWKLVFPVTDRDKINVRLGAEHKRIDLYSRSPLYYRQYIAEHGNSSNIYPLTVSWRRSTVDNFLWPTRGYIIDSALEATIPGASDHQYYKVTHQEWWFFPLAQDITLMLTGQAGLIKNYGKSHDVPFFYNFHTGGMGSVRGFDTSSLGPKINNWYGDVDYIGGTKMVTATAELFFPVPGLKNTQKVRLSLFADAGTLWDGKTRGMIDNYEYKNNYKSSFSNELRYSTGIGAVWLSPLGPLRFSWAKPLHKKSGDRTQSFQFNIGNTF